MASWLQERKEKRFYQEISVEEEISTRSYNATIGGILVYGLLMNAGICYAFRNSIDSLVGGNPIMFLIIYFVCCISGIVMSSKSNSPIISFIGYNLVVIPVGFVVSISVRAYAAIDPQIVLQAIVITMLVTGFMTAFAVYKPEFFEKLGAILLLSLGGLLIAELVLWIFRVDQVVSAWIGAAIFSLYIGYDFYKAQAYQKTLDNAVDSALDIYLDVINLFLRVLRILASSKSSSRSRR